MIHDSRYMIHDTGCKTTDAIRKDQIKLIKTLQSRLKMPDEEYRELIMSISAGFESSCTKLTEAEAAAVLEVLEQRGEEAGVWSKKETGKKEYAEFDGRPGMASGAQMRMMSAMWKPVSYCKSSNTARKKAFHTFLCNHSKVAQIKWVTNAHVQSCVEAFKKMKGGKR